MSCMQALHPVFVPRADHPSPVRFAQPPLRVLPLALLLRRNHLVGRGGILLRRTRRTLLGNLAPPASTLVVGRRSRRNAIRGWVYDSLISQLATSHKFLGKATSVESLRVRIDRVRNDLRL